MQEVLLAVLLAASRLQGSAASSAIWETELPLTCGDTYCPEKQCWNVSLRNPYPHAAAWSATVSTDGASDLSVSFPAFTDVLRTENDGLFALAWGGGRLACTETASYLELCLHDVVPSSSPQLAVRYDADPSRCSFQAQTTASELPQFVVITWDDAFTHRAFRKQLLPLLHANLDIRDACGGYPRHTFFVSNDNSDYAALSHVLHFGAEYALHTVAHEDGATSTAYWRKQLRAGIEWAQRLVPGLRGKEEWKPTGFRAPWLAHEASLYEALQETDEISYDSSLASLQRPIWPYPLERGAHEGCDLGGRNGSCPEAGNYHGIWEFPLNPLMSAENEVFLYDPPGTAVELWALLKDHLRRSYEGDRAPMTISLHAQYFFSADADQKLQLVQYEYAAKGKTVIFATMREILKWMEAGQPSHDPQELCSFFKLPPGIHAPSLDHEEICDGWDNNGDGQFDENLVHRCSYPRPNLPGRKQLHTCAPCPFHYPTDDGPEEHDDGLSLAWEGKVEVESSFSERPDGVCVFRLFLKLLNPHRAPSQIWKLTAEMQHLAVSSYYGTTLTNPEHEPFLPTVLRFENEVENGIVEGYGFLEGIEIGGEVERGQEERCVDREARVFKDTCWKLSSFLTQADIAFA